MSPEQLLAQLLSTASTRRKKSLEVLNEVCKEQYDRGSKDFSIAMIGGLSAAKNGPAEQSIRNKQGDDFKALISCWASYTGGSTKRTPKLIESPIYALLDKIPDPALRAVMGSILVENKKLKAETALLKKNMNLVIDRRREKLPTGIEISGVEVLPAISGLTPLEVEALKACISEKLLDAEGWSVDSSGMILNQRGRKIFPAGFVSAIKKVLKQL